VTAGVGSGVRLGSRSAPKGAGATSRPAEGGRPSAGSGGFRRRVPAACHAVVGSPVERDVMLLAVSPPRLMPCLCQSGRRPSAARRGRHEGEGFPARGRPDRSGPSTPPRGDGRRGPGVSPTDPSSTSGLSGAERAPVDAPFPERSRADVSSAGSAVATFAGAGRSSAVGLASGSARARVGVEAAASAVTAFRSGHGPLRPAAPPSLLPSLLPSLVGVSLVGVSLVGVSSGRGRGWPPSRG